MYTYSKQVIDVDAAADQINKLKSYIKQLVIQMNEREFKLSSLQLEYEEYVWAMDQAQSGIEQQMNSLNNQIEKQQQVLELQTHQKLYEDQIAHLKQSKERQLKDQKIYRLNQSKDVQELKGLINTMQEQQSIMNQSQSIMNQSLKSLIDENSKSKKEIVGMWTKLDGLWDKCLEQFLPTQ